MGVLPQWLHDSPQLMILLASGDVILSVENSGKPLGGRGTAPNRAGELTTLPRPPSWWGGAC